MITPETGHRGQTAPPYIAMMAACRTQTAAPAGTGPVAPALERRGAVPPSGHRAESETAGAVHRPRATCAHTEHALRNHDGKTRSARTKPAISRIQITRTAHPALPDRLPFSTASNDCGQRLEDRDNLPRQSPRSWARIPMTKDSDAGRLRSSVATVAGAAGRQLSSSALSPSSAPTIASIVAKMKC